MMTTKKTLQDFVTYSLEKSELFNSLSKHIYGGATSSNGHSTNTTGEDCDTATGDGDADPAKKTKTA